MPGPKSNKPKYCFHKTSGRAFVRIADRQIWLGKFGSQESKDKYDAVVGQWISQGRPGAAPFVMPSAGGIMLIELVEAYWNFAKEYYKNDPMRSDGHRVSIRGALDLIVLLFGETPVSEFGPLKFAVVLAEMIKPRKVQAKRRVVDLETGTSDVKTVQIERPGWTRGYANSQLKRLKRMFAWGVTRELLPPHICQALEMVEGLRKGKTAARESQPVRPARDEDVRKVLPLLPPPVRAMIKLEGLTAMRPGEARIMRGQDIELRQDVWIYRPQ